MLVVFAIQTIPAGLYYYGTWTGVSDEDAYLAHALTIGLDFDLDYSNEPIHQLNPRQTAPVHPIGPGLMAAPFVALFSVVDRVEGHPILQNHVLFLTSWSLFGFLFSKVVYFFAALWLYFDGARRIQPNVVTSGMTFLLAASASLLFYVLERFGMPHSFEFCTHALIFWASVVIWQRLQPDGADGRSGGLLLPALAAEVGVVLNLLVRPSNLHVILLPQIVVAVLLIAFAQSTHRIWKAYATLAAMLVVCLIPMGMLFFRFYGKPYPSMYDQYGPLVSGAFGRGGVMFKLQTVIAQLPYMRHILFSSDFGLIYSSPLNVMGTALLVVWAVRMAWERPRRDVLATAGGVLVYIGLSFSVALAIENRGMDYGWRYLFNLFPLAFLGYVLWLRAEKIAGSGRSWPNLLVRGVLTVFCVFSMAGQILYGGTKQLTSASEAYEVGVVQSLANPGAWRNAMLSRLPTYAAIKSWPVLPQDFFAVGRRLGFAKTQIEPLTELLQVTASAPARVSQQLIVLSIAWLTGSLWLLFAVPAHAFSETHDRGASRWPYALLALGAIGGVGLGSWAALRRVSAGAADTPTRRFLHSVHDLVGSRIMVYGRADFLAGVDGVVPISLSYRGAPNGSLPADQFTVLETGTPQIVQPLLQNSHIGYVLINTAQPRPWVFDLCALPNPLLRSETLTSGPTHFNYELYALGPCHSGKAK